MQIDRLKSSKLYELVYPIHEIAFVVFITPEAFGYDLRDDCTTKS
jgi:hypothetical protein